MKYIILTVIIAIITGCIWNPEEISYNVPYKFFVLMKGNASDSLVKDDDTFKFIDKEEYVDNRDDIKEIRFLEAAFRMDSVSATYIKPTSDSTIVGDCILNVYKINGSEVSDEPIFTKTKENFRPYDYLGKPYIFELTKEDIDKFNSYIEVADDVGFKAVVKVKVKKAEYWSGTRYIDGIVDVLFKVVLKL